MKLKQICPSWLKGVSEGQEIVIARAGKPVARLVAYEEKPSRRMPGSARGRFVMAPDFNDPLPVETMAEFEK